VRFGQLVDQTAVGPKGEGGNYRTIDKKEDCPARETGVSRGKSSVSGGGERKTIERRKKGFSHLELKPHWRRDGEKTRNPPRSAPVEWRTSAKCVRREAGGKDM